MKTALGLLEIHSWTATMVALDQMGKAADITVLQVEINDLYGACIKVNGSAASVCSALDAGRAVAEQMRVSCVTRAINAPDAHSRAAYEAKSEFSPLIEPRENVLGQVVALPPIHVLARSLEAVRHRDEWDGSEVSCFCHAGKTTADRHPDFGGSFGAATSQLKPTPPPLAHSPPLVLLTIPLTVPLCSPLASHLLSAYTSPP